MGNSHNQFLEYILLNMENDICKRIKNFCRSNIENIIYNNPRYTDYKRIEYRGVNDFGIQTAKVWEHREISEDTICFEIIANPEVIYLYDYDGHYSMDSDSYNYCQLRYIISKCKYFIGARTHSIISAYSTCTPAIALGYSIKSKGIAKDLCLPKELIVDSKNYTKDELLNSFKYLLISEKDIRKHLQGIMPEYIGQLKNVLPWLMNNK